MPAEDIQIGPCRLLHGDCRAVLPTLPDASVQLILVDPPYMGVKAEAWDRQWPTREAYLSWLRGLAKEWQRVLTPNGSLYCFASPQMAAHVEVTLGEVFTVLNHIRWIKEDGWHKKAVKEELRGYLSPWESVLFCEQAHADSPYTQQDGTLHAQIMQPLRAYMLKALEVSGADKNAVNRITQSFMADHWFTHPTQWTLPTASMYAKLTEAWPDAFYRDYEALRTDYEALRTDYEALRTDYEALRRPFTVSAQVPYTDVWDFSTVQAYAGKHPCEKPLSLLRHIILASSRPGDTVLDCFAGSGSTLDAARQCGRLSIGIEQDAAWVTHATRRLSQHELFAGSGTTGLAAHAEHCRALLIEQDAAYVAIAQQRLAEATRQGELFG